jgi:glycosyltransferase involved in cell wall biosynthesis
MVLPLHRALKLLIVAVDRFPTFRVDVAELFGRQMSARGHTLHWLLQSEDACARAYETTWLDGRVWVGSTNLGEGRLARLDKHLRGIANDFRLFKLVRQHRYDFVQVKDKFIAALFALLACKWHRVPMIYWLSYPFPESDLYQARAGLARYPLFYRIRGRVFKLLLYRLILPSVAHAFVQSEQMKRDVMKMGIAADKLTAVPMGISPSLATVDLGPPPGDATVVYLGTLARSRHLDTIVRAFRLVVDAEPRAKLFFVGAGDDADDQRGLEDEVERLGLRDHVVFTGFLPREQALEYVARADVCLSPFYPTPILNSTSPTKLIEYMALGRAVVGNHHPEQRMLIEESDCGLSVEWDERAFADAIVALLEDPARAAEMGRRGQRYVREHRNYERIAQLVESRYLELAAPRPSVSASATAE